MALFGAPLAQEDHAVRACYAALAMQTAVGQYAEEVYRAQGRTVQMRVGLNSGDVVVRTIGNDLHMDSSAIGQITHLAARMEQLARPGTTLLTRETLRLVAGLVQVTALGPVPIRGVPEPVEVFALVRASALRGRFHARVAGGLTRFVGRQHELESLRRALAQAATGAGQVVAAVGDAGVGKSRLLYEFLHAHHTHDWQVLESTSVAYGQATPYFPVIDLLKRYTHVEEHEDAQTIRARVTGQVLALDECLQDTLPALLSLLDALPEDSPFGQLDPPQRRHRTLDALKRLVLRESAVPPLLLVFEDLHWMDAETQALLESLVASLPTARLLLLVTYRPEYHHGWGSKTFYTQIRLDPLPPARADVLLQALLGTDPSLAPLPPLLIARTAGNPFFLEESVQTLVEAGLLVGERGAYRLIQPLQPFQMPATVQAVLAARIDRLPLEAKRLLQTAAVLGHEVPFPLLQAIAELPEPDLSRGLAQLQAAELLYETRLFPERAYTFKHALTHEVAYGSLLLERRRALHARSVDALEALAGARGAEQVDRLAHHALRGEVWDKALVYCRQAGEKALARSAYREAMGSFEQALSVLRHLPETYATRELAIDLRLALCSALRPLGTLGPMLPYLRDAESLAVALNDARRLRWVSLLLTRQFFLLATYGQAIATAQRVLALATSHEDDALRARAHQYLGMTYEAQGDYRRAIDLLRQTATSRDGTRRYERLGDTFLPAVFSRGFSAWCHAALGLFAEGAVLGEEGLQIAEAVGHRGSCIWPYYGLGIVALCQGDLRGAIPRLERAVGLCHEEDLPAWFPRMAAALGAAYTLGGRVVEALPLLTRAMEQSLTMGRSYFVTICSLPLGAAQLLAGRLEEAQVLAERALAHARAHQERGHQAYALRLLGEIARHRDALDVTPAATHYHQALALAQELGMRPLQAHCHRGLGTLYAQRGEREQARGALAMALELYRAMAMTFWLPQVEAALAQVAG